jgi:hypothetical protein
MLLFFLDIPCRSLLLLFLTIPYYSMLLLVLITHSLLFLVTRSMLHRNAVTEDGATEDGAKMGLY